MSGPRSSRRALAMNLWFGTNASVIQAHKRVLTQLGAQVSCMALDARMQQAQSFFALRADRLIWIEQSGQYDTLQYGQDSVWLNGRSVIPAQVTAFALHADGPTWNRDSSTQYAAWAKLDHNGDGHLDEDELDADYSHSLDAHELARAVLIEVQLGFADGSTTLLRQDVRAQ